MMRAELMRRLKEANIRVPPSGLIRSAQVEMFLEVSRETLRKWRDAGVLTGKLLGGCWHYDIDELARFLGDST